MKKLLTLVAGCVISGSVLAAEVTVEAPYARATAPGQLNSAVFMQLRNQGDATAIVGASSNAAKVVELHTHMQDEGVMRMRQIDAIELPANSRVELAPGGLHIMLIGLHDSLKVDSRIELTLEYADGTSTQLDLPVQMVMPAGMEHGKAADRKAMSHGQHQ